MNQDTRMLFEVLEDGDEEAECKAFLLLLEIMEERVDWVYTLWGKLLEDLQSSDYKKRAQAGHFLCYLAISDVENRLLDDFDQLWTLTYDEMFVVSRSVLQVSWRVGLAGEEQRNLLLKSYRKRFKEAVKEQYGALICLDITKNLKRLYDATGEIAIKQTSLELIELEKKWTYKKKYEKVWK